MTIDDVNMKCDIRALWRLNAQSVVKFHNCTLTAGRPPAVQCLFKLQHVFRESVVSKSQQDENTIVAVKSREALPGGGLREDL